MRLLDLADASIVEGLGGRAHVEPPMNSFSGRLVESIGAFVTVSVRGSLNGCIGNIEAVEPLGVAVPRLAWSAAFADPRLPPLDRDGYDHCTIDISVLSPLTPVASASRSELLAELRVGVDGLVVAAGARQGVFLPAVWEQIPDPDDFLDQLWRKAGLQAHRWPLGLTARRFSVSKYGRRAGAPDTPIRVS